MYKVEQFEILAREKIWMKTIDIMKSFILLSGLLKISVCIYEIVGS